MNNYIEEKVCTETSPNEKNIVVRKNNNKNDLTAIVYPFDIQGDYKIDIKELIEHVKNNINSHNNYIGNQKLIGDIEVVFTFDTAIRTDYGLEGLLLKLNYNLINENEIQPPN